MKAFHDIRSAVCLALLVSWPAVPGLAQGVLDEDSLFAQEELTLTEAVTGDLPEATGGDDFLNELFAGEELDIPTLPELEEEPLPESLVAEDFPDASTVMPEGEMLPQSLDAVVDGIAAEPTPEIEDFPMDDSFNADAVLDEMMEMGDSEAVAELAVDDTAVEPEDETEAEPEDENLDDVMGEWLAEEPVAEPAEESDEIIPDMDPSSEIADVATEMEPVEEKGVMPEDIQNVEQPQPAFEDELDLDALIGELAAESEATLPSDPILEEDQSAVETLPDESALAVDQATDEPPLDIAEEPLLDIAEEPLLDIAEEPPLDIAEERPPAEEMDDPMALDDDFFQDLASEARQDMPSRPDGVDATDDQQPREVAVDPFAGQPGDLTDGTGTGIDPVAAPPSAALLADEIPSATTATDEIQAFEDFTRTDDLPVVDVSDAPATPSVPEGVPAFETAERLKRKAQESHARNTLIAAEKALEKKDYTRAIRLFEETRLHMPRRADTEPLLARARKGLGEAYYQQALSLDRMEDFENARISAINAVRNGNLKGEALAAQIKQKIDAPPPPPPPAPRVRWKEEDYKTTQAQVNTYLRRGREAYLTGEYEAAILEFESVLKRDPENKEAIRLMRSAANKQYDRSSMELEATSARMIANVRDTWNPRQYGLHEAPIRNDGRMVTDRQEEEVQRMAILTKMGLIRIPEVDFRQANIRDVVNFLFQQSAEFDPDPNPANRKGVNIILKLDGESTGGGGAAAAAPLDPFAAIPAGGMGGGGAGGVNETLVTFSARDITLKEALDIVVDIAGLKYLIRGNVVMVMPRDAAVGEIEHRMYDVLPSAITRLQELSTAVSGGQGGGRRGGANDFLSLDPTGNVGGEDVDLKGFFQEMGVEWPTRSSIKFVRGLGKLVVANTLENLTVFEKVLSILNVVPYQIEIEARFVEVAQTDVDSLGLEWLLTDNWEIAQKKGSAGSSPATRQRIQMNANSGSGGFTAGNRFLSDAGIAGPAGMSIVDEIASISGVLTNPELTLVLHALRQKGHTDLLSAPKITTQSGQQAVIKVVTEYIYPTEFETSGIGGDGGGAVGAAAGGVVGAVVTPRDFTTREVGVILEVLPEVSPEGQMINLTLSPEVVSEPEWRNYGSTYTSYDPNGNPIVQSLNMEQPFFHTRKLKTSLLIYNGATVVMGGMITEVRNNVDDKVPLLGDIPLLGRLFRSRYESSEKRNLLIFVTARLVDPAGRAIDKNQMGASSGIAERIAGGKNSETP